MNTGLKFERTNGNIKQDIHVLKIVMKIQIFVFALHYFNEFLRHLTYIMR